MTSLSTGLTRRDVLQIGGLTALGLGLPRLLKADRERDTEAPADACILIFLNGGPSHHDTWDMKPEAPPEIRGEFRPIRTSLSGVSICEHLPRLAPLMNKVSLVRSIRHSVNNSHAAAVYTSLSGHDRGEVIKGGTANPDDYPAIGSVVALRRPPKEAIAPYVSLPYITKEGAGGPPQPGFFAGWLGRSHDPMFVLRNPNQPNFAMPELTLRPEVNNARLDDRRRLLDAMNRSAGVSLADADPFTERAFDLLSSEHTRKAFRISEEPERIRDSYGRNIYGQSILLARRLIEAGTRLVGVSWAPDANATWDTHGQNFAKLKKELLPQLDAALSSLLQDLIARDRLRKTLVVVMGEFGRTPKINNNAGRDHWNFCYSALLAGGGIREGYVHGASDKIGGRPSLNPCGPADIIATIYHHLGVPHDLELQDRLGRPMVLVPWGEPIHALASS